MAAVAIPARPPGVRTLARFHGSLEMRGVLGSPHPPAVPREGPLLLCPFWQLGAEAGVTATSTHPAAPVARGQGSRGGPGPRRRRLSPSSCLRCRNLGSRTASPPDVGWRLAPRPEEAARTSSRLGPQRRPSASTWRMEGGRAAGGGAFGAAGARPGGGAATNERAGRAPGAGQESGGGGAFGAAGGADTKEWAGQEGVWGRGFRMPAGEDAP